MMMGTETHEDDEVFFFSFFVFHDECVAFAPLHVQ